MYIYIYYRSSVYESDLLDTVPPLLGFHMICKYTHTVAFMVCSGCYSVVILMLYLNFGLRLLVCIYVMSSLGLLLK
jgi:hypothetical protein